MHLYKTVYLGRQNSLSRGRAWLEAKLGQPKEEAGDGEGAWHGARVGKLQKGADDSGGSVTGGKGGAAR